MGFMVRNYESRSREGFVKADLPFTPDEGRRFRAYLAATGRKAGPWLKALALAAMEADPAQAPRPSAAPEGGATKGPRMTGKELADLARARGDEVHVIPDEEYELGNIHEGAGRERGRFFQEVLSEGRLIFSIKADPRSVATPEGGA